MHVSRAFSTALPTSPAAAPLGAWPSSSNPSVIASLATAFKRQAYSSSTTALGLDPMTTGARSNLELDPRGVDRSVFEDASEEYDVAAPARPGKAGEAALEIISSLVKTDLAAAMQAYHQLRDIGTEFDDKAAEIFASAAARCASSPDGGRDAVRWLAAIPPKFSFANLHPVRIGNLLKDLSSTLVSLDEAASDTDKARHLTMALHIVVGRGLHLFRTTHGNSLRRNIQRSFMNIVRYASLERTVGTPPRSSITTVPASWVEWKDLEDAIMEREEDASLGAAEHPALFRNPNALSPSMVSAKLRTSIFRNSIRTLATSLRQRDALFWALRSSSIDEGATPDTDLDAFTVKVVVEEALKRQQDDLETVRMLDSLLSRLEAANASARDENDRDHFRDLFSAASRAHRAAREAKSAERSQKEEVSRSILAQVRRRDLLAASELASQALSQGRIDCFPSSLALSTLLSALERQGLSERANQMRDLMKRSNPGLRKSVTVGVLESLEARRFDEAVARWRAYFADDGGICDEVCRIALGGSKEESTASGSSPSGPQSARSGPKVWPRKGQVIVMLRALVGACSERPASLMELYSAWLTAAFGSSTSAPGSEQQKGQQDARKPWRQGGIVIDSMCFDVFLVAFAKVSASGTATERLLGILKDMRARGVEPSCSSWTKLLQTMASEEVLPERQEEGPSARKKSGGKPWGRFDGLDIDVEGAPAAPTTAGSSPGWASQTMKLAQSMGVGAPDGAPEPYMPRANLPTYVSLISGFLAGPSMKRWRALGLCLEIRGHLEAEARRGVTFTLEGIKIDPKAKRVLRRLAWLEKRWDASISDA